MHIEYLENRYGNVKNTQKNKTSSPWLRQSENEYGEENCAVLSLFNKFDEKRNEREKKRERKASKQRQSKRIVINEDREDIHAPTISLRGRREKRDDS